MAYKIDALLDKNGDKILPITRTNAIYDANDARLDNLLAGIDSEIAETNTKIIGKNLAGQSVPPVSGTTVTAGENAEIFNDYRERTFNTSGNPAAGNIASGNYSHAEGCRTTASGGHSHAEGIATIASGGQSHAEGNWTTASGSNSHAEGSVTTASGDHSHAEGGETTASGGCSHAEGYQTTASGFMSHAEGTNTTASGAQSHAEGAYTKANGDFSHAGGLQTIANTYQCVIGKFNISSAGATGHDDTTGDIFIIGNGGTSGRKNAFRVTTAGKAYGLSNFSGSGADYAEMWEIEGGNPDNDDWRGYFVTVNANNKICKASPNDYILGAISTTPCVVGDVQSEIWHDMYLKDVFGEKLIETVEVEETIDEDGIVTPAHTEKRWVLNPEYDPDKKYISRDQRPEWATVGLMGKLVVIDDGTCVPGQFCKVADGGIATASSNTEGYRVLERKNENHIRIMFR